MLDDFDQLLDESLKSYVASPERTGLEDRVFARAEDTRRPRVQWYLPAFAVAALAFALTVALWPTAEPTRVQPEQPRARADVPKLMPVVLNVAALKPRRRRVAHQAPLLRAHEPLSTEERALLDVAVNQPAQLARLSQPTEVLSVREIDIKPLSEEGEN